jgi:OOP family OmpA-OmpF porin
MLSRSLLALGLAVAAPAIAAAQPVLGPYISLGAGADLLQNENFHPAFNDIPKARSYRFDIGPAGEASLGYGLGNGLRIELEGDYADNHVRGVTFSTPLRAGGHEQQYGGFVNLLEDIPLPLRLPVTPYLGAGAGYRQVELDAIDSSLPVPNTGRPPPDVTNGSFAYQGIAGVAAPIGLLPGLAMTAEYRMIGVTSPSAYFRGYTTHGEPLYATVHNIFNHEVLVGLRLAFGPPPLLMPAPPPAPEAVPAPAAVRTYLVFFDWDRADLTPRARQIIADAAHNVTRVQTTRIEVDGYTDLSGTAKYNTGLSMRRAEAVAAELVRDGVARADIATQGFGEAHPLVPTAQGVREPQNRRVEIILK